MHRIDRRMVRMGELGIEEPVIINKAHYNAIGAYRTPSYTLNLKFDEARSTQPEHSVSLVQFQ
jgi:hypothetical protein